MPVRKKTLPHQGRMWSDGYDECGFRLVVLVLVVVVVVVVERGEGEGPTTRNGGRETETFRRVARRRRERRRQSCQSLASFKLSAGKAGSRLALFIVAHSRRRLGSIQGRPERTTISRGRPTFATRPKPFLFVVVVVAVVVFSLSLSRAPPNSGSTFLCLHSAKVAFHLYANPAHTR